jgi:hypothetical protein
MPEPKSRLKAISSQQADKWHVASKDEVNGLEDMKTWKVVRPVDGVKPINSTWVFKVKYTTTGESEKYKARLVV